MNTVGLLAYGETSVFALKALLQKFTILWIVTDPSEKVSATPVEKLASKYDIAIRRTNANHAIQELVRKTSPDAVVISSYNKILPSELLSSTKFINIHHGDLPRFRGRANCNWAIILGRNEIGLTFHEAIADLDAGRIYDQYVVPIEKSDTIKTLYDKFRIIIEEKLASIVEKVLKGYKGKEQKGEVTYCCTRLPDDGYIDWNQTSEQIYNFIRALTKPFPGAFTYFNGKRLYIWESEIPLHPKKYEGRIPGRIVAIYKDGVEILTQDGSIILKTVSYGGKDCNASDIIKTVKISLGISVVEFYEKMMEILKTK